MFDFSACFPLPEVAVGILLLPPGRRQTDSDQSLVVDEVASEVAGVVGVVLVEGESEVDEFVTAWRGGDLVAGRTESMTCSAL